MCPRSLRCTGFIVVASASAAMAGAARPTLPPNGVTLRLALGLKDKKNATWDGQLALSQGKVLGLEVKTIRAGKATGSSWTLRSVFPTGPAKKRQQPIRPVLVATLDAPLAAKATVTTPQGEFSFSLGDLAVGQPATFLDGQAQAVRIPFSVQLTAEPTDDDWPAAAATKDGTIWVAYAAYTHAPPLDAKQLHETRKFDSLKPSTHGDQVWLAKFDGTTWGAPAAVTGERLDAWRPTVAVDGKGTVWVVWSQNIEGNWDLYARGYDPAAGKWGEATRQTADPGADVHAVAVVEPKGGRAGVVWQGWRDGSFEILTKELGDEKESRLTRTPANEWCPAAAFDPGGNVYIAFDTYERGDYDVKLLSGPSLTELRTTVVAATPRYEARPSIAVDKNDRVWIAYEQGEVNWGKDTGLRWKGRTGAKLYQQRDIVVKCVAGGQLQQVKGVVPADPVAAAYEEKLGPLRRISLPQIRFDGAGRLWLLYRRHPALVGRGERWASFATHSTAAGWAPVVELANSLNVLDNRPALARTASGQILAIHSTDYRTSGTASAQGKNNDLYCTVLSAAGEAAAPPLGGVPEEELQVPAVHPNEPEDVKRIRDHRATVGGKTLRLLRGEFHRHTSLTAHQDMDGTLEEMWRYALDAAGFDWIGNGDHENGYGVEYLWWLVQKQTDLYHNPPRFTPMFTHERSRPYPSGHRNPMFAKRGIRPLPYHPGGREALFGTPEKGAADIKTLYAYLKHFDGICASHTSGTGMGTDWRDFDPEVEPIVEIFQGLRQNYEHENAPGAPTAKDTIGGYRPAGFVWNAWMKGNTLGVQVSSDHYSTHLSYAVVYAEDTTREAILDAFKKRHCYGALDNILLDVRCGDRMMGDIFALKGKPTLKIKAVGTEAIARLSIVRGVGTDKPTYVYDGEPNKQAVELTWTDQTPGWGQRSYYYVRVEQTRPKGGGFGALAWASPIWITAEE